MNCKIKLLASAATGLIAVAASPAFAAGTLQGTSITNTVTVNYQVGGVAQTAKSASDTITVDRKVLVTVAAAATTTSVVPGQIDAVTRFTVTNGSNDTIDILLGAAQLANGTAAPHGTDAFDTTGVRIYLDKAGGTMGSYDAGDTLVTSLDEVAPDVTLTVFVVSSIPAATTNGQVSAHSLTATAAAGGVAGTQGAVLANTTGANTAGVDNVFADIAGTDDAATDGKHSARNDYTVSAPVLTITKTSKLVSDPINLTSNPKAIPGAVIEYCITVANAAGGATATGLTISDILPTQVNYNANSIFRNGTVTSGVCNADGAALADTTGYNSTTKTVSGSLSDIAASEARTLRFQATIN